MNMKYVLKRSLGWILIITPIALIANTIPGLLVSLGIATATARIIMLVVDL